MFGSGKYVRDPTAGIADIKDLTPPEIVLHSYNYQREPCLHWGHREYRSRCTNKDSHAPRPWGPMLRPCYNVNRFVTFHVSGNPYFEKKKSE